MPKNNYYNVHTKTKVFIICDLFSNFMVLVFNPLIRIHAPIDPWKQTEAFTVSKNGKPLH